MKNEEPAFIILIPGFPANEEDTTCLPFQQAFVRSLKNQSPSLKIIVLTFHYPFYSGIYRWHDTEIISFNGRNRGGLARLLTWRKIRKTLAALNRKYKIKGVLSFWCGECSYINKQFSRKYQLPHLYWLMGQDAKKRNRFVSLIQPQPEELAALSDFLQSEFQRNYSIRPSHVVSPGVDTRMTGPRSVRDIDILGSGSLVPLKQFGIFVEVVYELKKKIPSIRALICGKGPEEKNLSGLIARLQLQDNITLAGELPHEDLLATMGRSRLLLHPSSYEGFSGVCLEALQAGARVISFCKPMNHEIKNWYVADSKETMAAKALEILLGSDDGNPPFVYKSIDSTVREILHLFGYQLPADSV